MTFQKHKWLLLVHQLPAKPSNLRVRIWRKLQQLGAVSIKSSIYVLPSNEKTNEDFQWLKQEIESSGGEATIFQADGVEGATDEEIVATFRQEREKDYSRITAEFDGLTGAIREQNRGGNLSAARFNAYEAEIDKLQKELKRLLEIDFFTAPNRTKAIAAFERCHKFLRTLQRDKPGSPKSATEQNVAVKLSEYQGRRWVTRKNLFVDRLAAIWLIKRFIDKRPRFFFVADGETLDGAIHFDMYGAEFSHRGEDCTFETMIKEFGFAHDPGLQGVAEVVHDIDLKDNKFSRTEAAGVQAVLQGLSEMLNDDHKLIQLTAPLFDGLYKLFSDKSGAQPVAAKTSGRGRKSTTRKSPH